MIANRLYHTTKTLSSARKRAFLCDMRKSEKAKKALEKEQEKFLSFVVFH